MMERAMIINMEIVMKDLNVFFEAGVMAAKNYEAILNKAGATASAVAEKKDALDAAIEKYNKAVTANTFEVCLSTEKPLLTAAALGFQDRLVRKVKQNKDKTFTVSVEVDIDGALVDLVELNKAKSGLPHDSAWVVYISSMQRLFAVAVAKALKDSDADAKGYAVKKAELGTRPDMLGRRKSILEIASIKSDADPFSIGSLTDVIQVMADMILGPDVVQMRRKDARYMLMFAAKEAKKVTYRVANDVKMLQLLQRALYARINDIDYAEFVK